MNDKVDPQIRAALDVQLSDERQFASRLILAAHQRRARRLCIVRLGAASTAAAIAIGGGALLSDLLSSAAQAQAVGGVGFLLLVCAFADSVDSETVR